MHGAFVTCSIAGVFVTTSTTIRIATWGRLGSFLLNTGLSSSDFEDFAMFVLRG